MGNLELRQFKRWPKGNKLKRKKIKDKNDGRASQLVIRMMEEQVSGLLECWKRIKEQVSGLSEWLRTKSRGIKKNWGASKEVIKMMKEHVTMLS